MHENKTPQNHPIRMLPVFRDLIDGGLEDITSNLANIKAIHAREHGTLDDHTAKRFVALFAEGLEFVPLHAKQLARWLKSSKITATDRAEVMRIQAKLVHTYAL